MAKDTDPIKARKRAGNDAACASRKIAEWARKVGRADIAAAVDAAAADIAAAVATLRSSADNKGAA